MKPTIVWMVDGCQWGFDIRANLLSKLMTNYNHKQVVVLGKERDAVLKEIRDAKADIILVMNQKGLRYLDKTDFNKIIVGLSSLRTFQGWKR